MAIEPSARNLYELIDRTSPSSASFQTDGGAATMDFIIDRANLGALVSDILGSVYKAGDGTGRLVRRLPAAHPYYDWLFASKITNIEGIQPAGRSLGETYQRDKSVNYIYDFVFYQKYKVTVQFEPRPYLLMNDTDLKGKQQQVKWYYDINDNFVNFTDPKEYLRFVDIESEPNTEFLTSPQGQFNFKTQSGAVPNGLPATNQNGGGIVLRIVKQKVKFTWYFVPYEIVFAENVVSGFGKVNQYDFFGYPKGSLLLEGIESKRYPPPEVLFKVDPASGSSVAQKLCDVTFVFSCFMQPYRDLSADIPASTGFKITYGHNLLPRAGELKYYYVQTKNPTNPALDGRPVYESYPMERLFKLD